ncbi:MAG TPA: ABC transporter permease [Planctomycetota bacterium]|nr:ABC transporter permease [Planctomycetota bacterium]
MSPQRRSALALAGVAFAFLATFSIIDPAFLTVANQRNVLQQIGATVLLGTGMTLVVLTGGIDLAVASTAALSAVAGAMAASAAGFGSGALALGVVVALATGAAVGTVQGSIVALAGVPPFLVTLAGLTVLRGAAFLLCDGVPVANFPEAARGIGRGFVLESWLGSSIPASLVVVVAFVAAAEIVLRRTAFGRSLYAIGGNSEAARLAGLPVRRDLIAAYAVSGLAAAAGGLLVASRQGSADPKLAREGLELDAVAAVVLGGTSLSGGRGSAIRTFVGAWLIGSLRPVLNHLGVESYGQDVAVGLVILAAALLDRFMGRGRD